MINEFDFEYPKGKLICDKNAGTITMLKQNSEGDDQTDNISVNSISHLYLWLAESKLDIKYNSVKGQQDIKLKVSKTTPKNFKPLNNNDPN